MDVVVGSGDGGSCFLLLFLNLGQLLVESVQLRLALRDVRAEDFQLGTYSKRQKVLLMSKYNQDLPLLCDRGLQLTQVVLIGVLNLCDVGLLLLQLCHHLSVLFTKVG